MAASTFKPPTKPAGRVSEFEYGQYLDEWFADTPAELVYPLNLATYSAMRRDGSIAAIQQGYTLQLRRAQWQLDGRGCDPAVTQMVADDMGLPILGEDMPGAARTRGVSWSEHLRVALNQALTFGHSGFALGADTSSGDARLNVLAERPPWTINEIHVDPVTGAFLGVTQDGFSKADTPQIKAREMAWYCLDREGGNWAGRSMYYSAWLYWLVKREMIRVHATSNRRWGAGVPVMEALPGTAPDQAEMQAAAAMAEAARSGEQAGAASPPGFQLKILGLSGAVPDTLAFVEWLDSQITRASLMSHLELGQGSSGGAYALGAAFIDSWVLALETLGSSIADTATRQIAARIVEWNRGEDEPVPRVTVAGVGSRREVTAESLQLLLTSGGLTADPNLESWIRREYHLPEAAPLPVAVPGVTLPGQSGATTTLPDGSMVPTPAGASSTDAGLVTAALTAATSRNWGALDEVAAQMQAREAAAPAPEAALSPQWAAVADDEGLDWKIDAAMARGVDIASAFASIYPGGDEQATLRGHDIWAADRQIAGDTTPATLDAFKALVGAAPAPTLTLDMDNRLVALAVRLGQFSASFAQPITACPYVGADAEQTALRRVWLSSYLRIRPADTTTPTTGTPATVPADPGAKPAADPAMPAAAPAAVPPVKATTRVIAAAGHPNSCAHANLGSVCHCECAGVRHGWLGSMPSGVKVPQGFPSGTKGAPGGMPDVSGVKTPQEGLPGVHGNKTPQSNPELEALGGHKAPAGLSGEKAPAPNPPSEPEPSAPAQPSEPTPRTFDERSAAARNDDNARTSAPLSLVRNENPLSSFQNSGLRAYISEEYRPINMLLRGGNPDDMAETYDIEVETVASWIDGVDSAMDESRLPDDVITWRGLEEGGRLFGAMNYGDLTGFEWRELAFSSTTTDLATAETFAGTAAEATIMRVLTPAGTGAVELSGEEYESELLLDRGLRMRIVADRGIDEHGRRQIDVEVVPSDGERPGFDRTPGIGSDESEADWPHDGLEDWPDDWSFSEGQAGGGLHPADPAPAEGRTDPAVPAGNAPTAPTGPADQTRSYDDRAAEALSGSTALRSAPLSYVAGLDQLTAAQEGSLRRYRGGGYEPINALLRTGDPGSLESHYVDETPVREWIDGLDSAFDSSPLPSDVVAYRGLANADRLFGDRVNGDLTGAEWREDAYSSTSTDPAMADQFATNYGTASGRGSVSMRLLVPTGTGAVELSDASFESELLLERNLRMRVAADHGVDEGGIRRIDVEVLPGGERPANTHSGRPPAGDDPADWVDVGGDPSSGATDPGAPDNMPASGDGPRSYGERLMGALEGPEASESVPLSRVRSGARDLTAAETEVLNEYTGNGFLPINHLLRGGDPSGLSRWDAGRDEPLTEEMVDSWTGAIDELMAESHLPADTIVWRGTRSGIRLFGDAFDDDLVGAEWREDAFASTSTDESTVEKFATDQLGNTVPGSTIMQVLVPAGTGALELSGEEYESELLLQRGLRFRVVEDWGLNEAGIRVLDVEVIPDEG